jgi:unsaturated rhamnogalacturonyl hydrolase
MPHKNECSQYAARSLITGRLMKKLFLAVLVLALGFLQSNAAFAQTSPPVNDERAAAGDQPDDPGPLATDLSPDLKRPAILKAMMKVANWQLQQSEGRYNIQWTFAALYDGLLAASKSTGDKRYHDRVLQVARDNHWEFGPRFAHADDEAIGLTYVAFYAEDQKAEEIAPTRNGLDKLLVRPDDPQKNLWWWCDALYMAPPVLTQISVATGHRRYLDFMNREWWITSGALYDPAEHLYFRDDRFLTMHEANGKKVFWSRGNGWVLAGLAFVLERMPADYPDRAKYEKQFKEIRSGSQDCNNPMDCGASACSIPAPIQTPRFQALDFLPTPWRGESTTSFSTAKHIFRSSRNPGKECSPT